MQYVYIHGFGTTGAGSNKFRLIKDFAKQNNDKAIALEWTEFQQDIVIQLTQQLEQSVQWHEPICLIGSSTGGNFTYQLLEKFVDKELFFVLINPLLNVEQRKIENLNFPLALAAQLKNPQKNLSDGLIILGKNDEVLDYQYTYDRLHSANKIVTGNWNHTLSNMDTAELLLYINSVKE